MAHAVFLPAMEIDHFSLPMTHMTHEFLTMTQKPMAIILVHGTLGLFICGMAEWYTTEQPSRS